MVRRLLLCFVLGLGACGDDGDSGSSGATTTTTAACGSPEAKPLDPGSGQHLLPGAAEPTYNTNPPTSGAHAPGAHPTGVLTAPISRPVQAAMLENGEVLVQYDEIPEFQRRAFASLVSAGNHVTVAPNPDLPSPIVATAWEHMLQCQRVDVDALRNFVSMHAGKHGGH